MGVKRLLTVILVLWGLGAVVPGCRHALSYDGRLTAVDSLMKDNPDSALALVEALSPSDLPAEGDRAYRDLLLTQARYKSYVTATSDSVINRALAYFRTHPADREKLTRAYIYKGAVMDELGYPDSAMLYYKHAEATAAPDDYFNLGYCKMRMGALYRDFYAMDGKPIELFEEALSLFTKSNNLEYKYRCLNNLGCLYRDINPSKAERLLEAALSISKQRKDTANYIEDLHALAVLYYYNEDYDKALTFIQKVAQFDQSALSFPFCTTAANVYAKNGMTDSATLYLNLASQFDFENNEKYKMYYLESDAEIQLANGDTLNSLKLSQKEKLISDSLITNTEKPKIARTESTFDKTNSDTTRNRLYQATKVILLTALIAGIFTLLFLVYKKRYKQSNQIIDKLRIESEKQLKSLDDLQKNFDELQIKEDGIRQFISTQLGMLRDITANCYYQPHNKLGKEIKKIVAFQDKNMHLWSQIYDYIDAEYNDIITNTRKNHPDLNDKELLLLALSCMNYSYIQMTIILGYSNSTSVGTLKTRLSEKLGCSVNDYITTMTHK